MKTGLNQRIKLYVEAKAIPLNAIEAIKGSPSPWNVLAITPKHAIESARRLRVSALDNETIPDA